MIIDTSAVLAILRDEPEAAVYAEAIQHAGSRRMSAVSFVEAAAIIDGGGDPVASRGIDDLVDAARITIDPVTPAQARIARAAFRDFGRGSGHPARLNFVDCFSYALAKAAGEPLLFKGKDFVHTDVEPALP